MPPAAEARVTRRWERPHVGLCKVRRDLGANRPPRARGVLVGVLSSLYSTWRSPGGADRPSEPPQKPPASPEHAMYLVLALRGRRPPPHPLQPQPTHRPRPSACRLGPTRLYVRQWYRGTPSGGTWDPEPNRLFGSPLVLIGYSRTGRHSPSDGGTPDCQSWAYLHSSALKNGQRMHRINAHGIEKRRASSDYRQNSPGSV